MAQDAQKTYGRGGAGNISSRPAAKMQASDLETPTIKSTTYTTGRGGSGNMAKSNPTAPEETRAAQDVDTPAHHTKELEGTYHWGRGGQGNMTTLGKSGAEQARQKSLERKRAERLSKGEAEAQRPNLNNNGNTPRSGSFSGIVNKGKEMLGLNKDKKGTSGLQQDSKASESAIED
ncbi:hypothetical protein Slin15195_G111750 [Septoria linicola]|uniref:Uncharacterized protein n=1 Tax=Septoria linicola TaxID=215465 RepID=A0A9Q9ENI9_9PEZI|nr:hypothetical protein Slin14017_G110110 [Septoria linicola]USW57856.1 hypothetical protein Slin15195_G111750 [Septoria linicola]